MSPVSEGPILLTGSTGFVGMELLARYMERSERKVITLIRARDDAEAQARLDRVLVGMVGESSARAYRGRVTALAGELTADKLGLGEHRWERLADELGTIVHSAASVSFTLPIDEARAINLKGTQRMLELARRAGSLDRYAHISTAYVAGTHEGRFLESDHDVGQEFRNTYEQSKFEAEALVRGAGVPYTILRPSIVVGEHRSGWTSAFNVLYWPLRAFARGLFTAVPAIPSAPVDVVPVDYVADAIHALCEGDAGLRSTFHLTAGSHASTIQEIAHAAARYFKRPLPQVLTPSEFAQRTCPDRERSAIAAGTAYFPYFAVRTVFDNALTRALLEPRGIRAAPLGEYLERLLDFATQSRWGKRPMTRADSLARIA